MKMSVMALSIGVFCWVSAEFAYGKNSVMVQNLDGIRYRTVSANAGGSRETEILHPVLLSAREDVFNEFGLVLPARQNVTIACGAAVFRELTGLSSSVAAVYIPGRNELVMQRPSALLVRKTLDQVVRHELLHYAVALSRQKAGVPEERWAGLFWLEESFCTAECPAGLYDAARGRKIIDELGDRKKIKKYLEQFLRSENERERADAYASALVFGSALRAKYGKMKIFAAAAGTESLDTE